MISKNKDIQSIVAELVKNKKNKQAINILKEYLNTNKYFLKIDEENKLNQLLKNLEENNKEEDEMVVINHSSDLFLLKSLQFDNAISEIVYEIIKRIKNKKFELLDNFLALFKDELFSYDKKIQIYKILEDEQFDYKINFYNNNLKQIQTINIHDCLYSVNLKKYHNQITKLFFKNVQYISDAKEIFEKIFSFIFPIFNYLSFDQLVDYIYKFLMGIEINKIEKKYKKLIEYGLL